MKKLLGIVSVFILGLTLAACSAGTTKDGESLSYMSVDINPSIEFVLNAEGEIESYNAKNEDAEIVVASIVEKELDFVGLNYEAALELFIEEAIELGYIDVNSEDNVIVIDIASDDEEQDEAREEEALNRAQELLKSHGIAGIAIRGEYGEEIADIAAEYEVGLGVARIMFAATLIDEDLTIEAAADMNVGQLMAIIRTEHRQSRENMNERAQENRAMANAMREDARQGVEEHRNNLEDSQGNMPDVNAIRDRMMENRANVRADYEARVELRRERIREELDNDTNDDDTNDQDSPVDDETDEDDSDL